MVGEESPRLDGFECPICYKQYTIRSSYVRHSRKCLEQIVSSSKQKSCRQCSDSKVRCDKNRPTCSRCASRGDPCGYVTSHQRRTVQLQQQKSTELRNIGSLSLESDHSDSELTPHTGSAASMGTGCVNYSQRDSSLSSIQLDYGPVTPVSNLAPVCQPESGFADVSQQSPLSGNETLTNLHINPEITGALAEAFTRDSEGHTDGLEAPSSHCVSFLSRILRTYPRMMSRRDQVPPFIHETQVSNKNITLPLANCFALSRMWQSGYGEAASRDIVESSIRREMEKLFNEYRSYDAATLLAAFQSSLIYAIILLFPAPGKPPSKMLDLPTIVSLRELGDYVSHGDLILSEEKSHTRPTWQEWVRVSCKRRTFHCLNLFVWINAIHNGFSNFPCAEVDFIPAPAGKLLWNIVTQETWEIAYDRWLGRWAGLGIYTLGDLRRAVPGSDSDLRSEMWLEEADEFGIMCVAVTR